METNLLEKTIDVRTFQPKDKHPTIFNAWYELPTGGSLLLVNDHDPVPLYYQFACEHTGTFRWEYLESGPPTWQVRISKGDYPDPGFVPTKKTGCAPAAPIEFAKPLVVDTRPIFARGETPCQVIEDAAAKTILGQTFVLLVPFEPVPLYTKLANDGFTHQAAKQEDGSFKVEFKRVSPGSGKPIKCEH